MDDMLDPDDRDALARGSRRSPRRARGIRARSGRRRSRRAAAAWDRWPARAPSPAACARAASAAPASMLALRFRPVSSSTSTRARLAGALARRLRPKAAPTSTFSKVVMPANGCGIWKERRDAAMAALGAPAARVTSRAVEDDAARIGHHRAGDQVEQRRLAGAVRPDDAERLARVERQADVVGDLQGAVALADAVDGQDRQVRASSAHVKRRAT